MKFQTIKFPVPAVFPRPAIRASRNCHAGFLKPVAVFLLFNLLALGTLVLPAGAQSHPPTNFNATVPVYQIIQAGATGTQASNLANGLNIPPAQLTLNNGLVSYLNPNGFLTFPTNGITNVPIVSNLVAQTSNQFPSIPIAPIALNFAALSNLSVLPDAAAMTSASNALNNAGLLPQFGTPFINHVFTPPFSPTPTTPSARTARHWTQMWNTSLLIPTAIPSSVPVKKCNSATTAMAASPVCITPRANCRPNARHSSCPAPRPAIASPPFSRPARKLISRPFIGLRHSHPSRNAPPARRRPASP